MVTEVDPKSAAAERGFKEGDVILEVAGKSVTNAGDVREAINAARSDNKNSVLMRVKTGGSSRFVAVPLAQRLTQSERFTRWRVSPALVAPADGSFRGAGLKTRSHQLPSGGIRPPPSEGPKGGEVPQLHRPLFSLNREATGRLA